MKKNYTSPVMETEIFETSDIITVSIVFNNKHFDVAADQNKGIPVVDAGALEYDD